MDTTVCLSVHDDTTAADNCEVTHGDEEVKKDPYHFPFKLVIPSK